MVATAGGIIKEEGASKLFRGLSPALYRHLVYSGVRIVTYDTFRYLTIIFFIVINYNILYDFRKKFIKDQPALWKSAISGVTAGALAQFLASPADLVKVHVQMEGRRLMLGLKPRVTSAGHAFREIVRRGGVKGLWKGSVPNVQRAALVNLGDLTTYDTVKRFIITNTGLPDCHTVHIMSSICAGFVAATMVGFDSIFIEFININFCAIRELPLTSSKRE